MTAKIEPYCQTCGEFIPEPNVAYGISPDALCRCCKHDRIAAPAPKQVKVQELSITVGQIQQAIDYGFTISGLEQELTRLIHAAEKEQKDAG